MLLWQAHMALAESLGDPIIVSGSPSFIPNGVRYSKKLRNLYIYKAMLSHLRESITEAAKVPKPIADEYLHRIYPNFMEKQTFPKPVTALGTLSLDKRSVHVYVVDLGSTTIGNMNRMVFTERNPHSFQKSMSRHHLVRSEPVYYTMKGSAGTDVIYYMSSDDFQAQSTIANFNQMEVLYIPVPKDPEQASNGDEALDFEELHLEKVLNMATVYGRIDDQDLADFQQFLPAMIK